MNVAFGVHDLGHPTRKLLCQLCTQFYTLGWVSGTGGGIAIREDDEILVAPSGVQKERLSPEDLFVVDIDGNIQSRPKNPDLKLSECWPLFQHAFKKRGAGAIIHSHSIHAVLATRHRVGGVAMMPKDFNITGFEMIKGLRGKGCFDKVTIPIIENTAHECELADDMGQAMDAFADVDAVLVRNHGVYVWGDTWEKAKTQAECLDYLFNMAARTRGVQ